MATVEPTGNCLSLSGQDSRTAEVPLRPAPPGRRFPRGTTAATRCARLRRAGDCR